MFKFPTAIYNSLFPEKIKIDNLMFKMTNFLNDWKMTFNEDKNANLK